MEDLTSLLDTLNLYQQFLNSVNITKRLRKINHGKHRPLLVVPKDRSA